MCQNMAYVDSTESVINFRNQPVPIAFNVEDCPFPDGIRARKSPAYVRQTFPLRFLRNPKPCVQRNFKFAAPRDGFFNKSTAVLERVNPRYALADD